MEFLKRPWTQAQVYLEGMSFERKLIICLVGLLLVGLLSVVLYFVGTPERVPISAFAAGRSEQVLVKLRRSGIDADTSGGQITVPLTQRDQAILLLVEDDLLGEDVSAAFDQLIVNTSVWETKDQRRQRFLIAKQTVLERILETDHRVKHAHVIIDPPEEGFGRSKTTPSASVSITTRPSRKGDKNLVVAAAALVSGAVAKMAPSDVSIVIDGRTFPVHDHDDMLPANKLEYVRNQERHYTDKIRRLLGSYIQGVLVEVTVRVDPTQHSTESEWEYEANQPVFKEINEEHTRRDRVEDGEAGVRSNTSMTIAGSSGTSTEESTTRTETEFGKKKIRIDRRRVLSGYALEQINVSVGVPRSFFAGLYKASHPDDVEEPTDQDLQPIIDTQLAQIKDKVEPLLIAKQEGFVQVDMVPDLEYVAQALGNTSSSIGTILGSGWAKSIGVGALAMLSLALMLGMVRKATRPESLPSIQDLAGVPPDLETEAEMIGEAQEIESSMTGVELAEEELRSREVAEQVTDLVKHSPEEASDLLRRWLRSSE